MLLWCQRLTLKCDEVLSNFASDFNMRLYTEVMLFSEGFETSKDLSRKMVGRCRLNPS